MRTWRKSTWVFAGWNVLMIAWFVRVMSGLDDFSCARESGGFGSAMCQAGAAIGQNYGVTLVVLIWLVGAIALGLIWFSSRPRDVPR